MNKHHLQCPVELPEGITASVDDPKVLLTIPVRAPMRGALATAREATTDLPLVLATTFNGYELVDALRQSRGTDVVYRPRVRFPRSTSQQGVLTEYGVQSFDPNGELRRAGRILTIRASASVTHPHAEDVRRIAGRTACGVADVVPRDSECPRRNRRVHVDGGGDGVRCCKGGSN